MTKVPTSFSFQKGTIDRLDELARVEGLSRSELAEELLLRALGEEEHFVSELDSPIMGRIMQAVSHPGFIRFIATKIGRDVDMHRVKVAHRKSKRKHSVVEET